MIRMQIYLTDLQHETLASMSKKLGKKKNDLIREAVDRFIEQASDSRREIVLKEAAGIWKDRTDLPDFREMRNEWDRPGVPGSGS